MVRLLPVGMVLAVALFGCGEPVRGIDENAKAAKAQAREAVQAAQDAAQRVDELSRIPVQDAPPAGEPERHE
jgi:Trk K+ transport system NAD-binding subunit